MKFEIEVCSENEKSVIKTVLSEMRDCDQNGLSEVNQHLMRATEDFVNRCLSHKEAHKAFACMASGAAINALAMRSLLDYADTIAAELN